MNSDSSYTLLATTPCSTIMRLPLLPLLLLHLLLLSFLLLVRPLSLFSFLFTFFFPTATVSLNQQVVVPFGSSYLAFRQK